MNIFLTYGYSPINMDHEVYADMHIATGFTLISCETQPESTTGVHIDVNV